VSVLTLGDLACVSPADCLRELFRPVHPPGTLENNLAPENFKGVIDPKEAETVRCNFGVSHTERRYTAQVWSLAVLMDPGAIGVRDGTTTTSESPK
jgi:hypothetical protein